MGDAVLFLTFCCWFIFVVLKELWKGGLYLNGSIRYVETASSCHH